MAAKIFDLYMVKTMEDLAGELRQSKAVVFAWEWSLQDGALEVWQNALLLACDDLGVPVYFVAVPEKNLTFAINADRRPSTEIFLDSVSQIEHSRLMLEPIPSKEDAQRARQHIHRLAS